MHDDRLLVEGRLTRAMGQFIRPAIYADRVPLALTAWHVDGEPVPVGEALKALSDGAFEPFAPGTPGGRPGRPAGSVWRAPSRPAGRAAGWRR